MTTTPHTEADYAAMADALESGDYVATGPVDMGSTLRMGRPARGERRQGKSPGRTIRFPADLDAALLRYADEHHTSPSEVVRHAVQAFLSR